MAPHLEIDVDQFLQIVGAILILVAFAGAQGRKLDQRSYLYLLLNLAGSIVLAILAWIGRQWGFLLLETAWALVSLLGLIVRARGEAPTPAH